MIKPRKRSVEYRVIENHDAHVRAWVNAVQDRAVAEAGVLTEIAMRALMRATAAAKREIGE
jgi:membrane protein required for beta-lactamase induction